MEILIIIWMISDDPFEKMTFEHGPGKIPQILGVQNI